MLPIAEEADEILRRDRFDFLSQPPQREPMDAREQVALAPLLVADGLVETAAHRIAVAFERRQGHLYVGGNHAQSRRQLRDRHRAAAGQAHAYQLAQRILARPVLRRVFGGCGGGRGR